MQKGCKISGKKCSRNGFSCEKKIPQLQQFIEQKKIVEFFFITLLNV